MSHDLSHVSALLMTLDRLKILLTLSLFHRRLEHHQQWKKSRFGGRQIFMNGWSLIMSATLRDISAKTADDDSSKSMEITLQTGFASRFSAMSRYATIPGGQKPSLLWRKPSLKLTREKRPRLQGKSRGWGWKVLCRLCLKVASHRSLIRKNIKRRPAGSETNGGEEWPEFSMKTLRLI